MRNGEAVEELKITLTFWLAFVTVPVLAFFVGIGGAARLLWNAPVAK